MSSNAALDLAAQEAARRRRPLCLMHAFIWPYLHVPTGPLPYGTPEGGLRHQAEHVLAGAYTRAHTAAPDLGIHGDLGSVSQAVLHHAACPVAIVPHTAQVR